MLPIESTLSYPEGLNWLSVLMRLGLATLLGCTLGIERTRKGRAAGMRTYGLVSVGAALVIMTSQYINLVSSIPADPTRMAAQVISGIGFLGAGTILLTARHRIMGLTTAAGLWASACIGLAAGVGFYLGALAAYAVSFFLIALCDNYRAHVGRKTEIINLFVILKDKEAVTAFLNAVQQADFNVSDLASADADIAGGVSINCALRRENFKCFDRFETLAQIRAIEGVTYVEETS